MDLKRWTVVQHDTCSTDGASVSERVPTADLPSHSIRRDARPVQQGTAEPAERSAPRGEAPSLPTMSAAGCEDTWPGNGAKVMTVQLLHGA